MPAVQLLKKKSRHQSNSIWKLHYLLPDFGYSSAIAPSTKFTANCCSTRFTYLMTAIIKQLPTEQISVSAVKKPKQQPLL